MFLEDLQIPHELNVPLAPHTWYGVGGHAAVLAHPASVEQLAALVARARENNLSLYVLGSGANLLVRDEGVPGIVVKLDAPCFRQVSIQGNRAIAGGGYDLARLVLQTAKAGLKGLECLAGVPATVGGAVRMNAGVGGFWRHPGRSVIRVRVMDAGGGISDLGREMLVFSYRKSSIAAPFILEAEFELGSGEPEALVNEYKRIMALKSESQPLADHSAGCAFKNPPPSPDGKPRSAGKLIDDAGLKGFRIGKAEVSPQHANFTIAHPGCTATDILAVIEHVQRVVLEKSGVTLEREVVVWP